MSKNDRFLYDIKKKEFINYKHKPSIKYFFLFLYIIKLKLLLELILFIIYPSF
jgi:hypothetical protein